MLGLPVTSWMRFYLCGFVAGLSLSFVRFAPMAALGIVEMVLAICGMALMATYTRSYLPREWRRWAVRVRRLRMALSPAPWSHVQGSRHPRQITS